MKTILTIAPTYYLENSRHTLSQSSNYNKSKKWNKKNISTFGTSLVAYYYQTRFNVNCIIHREKKTQFQKSVLL